MNRSVLIVESVRESGEKLARLLTDRGYTVAPPSSPHLALDAVTTLRPGLILAGLDVNRVDGLDLCRRLREATSAPLLILSDDPSEAAEVSALECGADDYILRPVGTALLVARVRALARRVEEQQPAAVVNAGPFHIDFDDRRVRVRGRAVRLTPKEFDLFTFMARRPNRVLPHKTLLGAVWGTASEEQSEYLRVFVGQLRKKLEADPAHPCHLLTEPWVGYRFNPDGASA